jgi:hypothetical protein
MPGAKYVRRRREQLMTPLLVGLGCSVFLAFVQSINVHLMRRPDAIPRPWVMTFALVLPSWIALAAAAPVTVYAARRFSFAPRSRWTSAAAHGGLSLAFALTHMAAMSGTYTLFGPVLTWERAVRNFYIAFRYLFLLEILVSIPTSCSTRSTRCRRSR